MNNKQIFNEIYQTSYWGYKSGEGSIPANAIPWINTVNKFIAKDDVHSVLDLGCGDWRLGSSYNLLNKKYLGVDASQIIIDEISHYANDSISFICEDMVTMDINNHDLIIIKDVFQHLPNNEIQEIMNKVFQKCKYALICNDFSNNANRNIGTGGWRELDLNSEPFNYNLEQVSDWHVNLVRGGSVNKMIFLYTNNDYYVKVDK
jgi:SAM-dependent methyltransferase